MVHCKKREAFNALSLRVGHLEDALTTVASLEQRICDLESFIETFHVRCVFISTKLLLRDANDASKFAGDGGGLVSPSPCTRYLNSVGTPRFPTATHDCHHFDISSDDDLDDELFDNETNCCDPVLRRGAGPVSPRLCTQQLADGGMSLCDDMTNADVFNFSWSLASANDGNVPNPNLFCNESVTAEEHELFGYDSEASVGSLVADGCVYSCSGNCITEENGAEAGHVSPIFQQSVASSARMLAEKPFDADVELFFTKNVTLC